MQSTAKWEDRENTKKEGEMRKGQGRGGEGMKEECQLS